MRTDSIKAQAPRTPALAKHLDMETENVESVGGLRSPDYVSLNPNMKAPTPVDGD
jgi:glutathione S-transferase